MASLVLSAAGNYFGGPIGAYIGSYVGGMIDQKIFGKSAPDIEGQRLSDLKVQVSTYGNMLPITYGTTRLAGNIIWSTPLQETKHSEDAGGKGGGGQEINSYTYSVNFSVALTEGTIDGIRRIWANGNLIYDRSDTVSNNNVKVLVYTGSETQLPDPLMQAYLGAGNVPAYRGTAYAVFENLQLEKFGNRIPNLSFEVVNNGADYLLPIVSSTANNGFVLAKYAHVNQSPLFYAWRTTQLDVFVHLNEIAIYNTTTNTYDIFYNSTNGYAINDILYVDYVLNDLGLPIQLEQIWVVGPQEFYGGVGIISGYGAGMMKRYSGQLFPGNDQQFLHLFWDEYMQCVVAQRYNPSVDDSVLLYFQPELAVFYNAEIAYPAFLIYDTGVNLGGFLATPNNIFVYRGGGGGNTHFAGWNNSNINTSSGTPIFYTPDLIYNTNLINGNSRAIYDALRQKVVAIEIGITGNYQFLFIDANLNVTTSALKNHPDFSAVGIASGAYIKSLDQYLFLVLAGPLPGRYGLFDPATLNLIDYSIAGDTTYGSSELWGGALINSVVALREGYFYTSNKSGYSEIPYDYFLSSNGVQLSFIVNNICARLGLAAGDIDVTNLTETVLGYQISQISSGRGSIEPLQVAYYFDAVESDNKIKFVKRGGASAVTIPQTDMAVHEYGQETPSPINMKRAQELDLPREINVTYADITLDYQQNTQKAIRMTGSGTGVVSIPLSIVLNPAKAKQVTDVSLFNAWSERTQFELSISRKYAYLEPTDVISFEYAGNMIDARITKKDEGSPGLVKLGLAFEDVSVYTQSGTGAAQGKIPVQTVDTQSFTNSFFMDIPLLRDVDNGAGFYLAASGYNMAWPGASIYRSIDGTSYNNITVFDQAVINGVALSILGDYLGGNTVDELNTVEVFLYTGELSSINTLQLLNGGNAALIGSEIIQFKTATLIAANKYRLSGFLRARRGSDDGAPIHAILDKFVLLNPATLKRIGMETADIGLVRYYKSVTLGGLLASTTPKPFTNSAKGLECYSPVLIGGGLLASGNLQINWVRRTRIDGAWRDYVEVAQPEAAESYEVDILNTDGTLKRTLSAISTNTTQYSAANIASDFPAGLPNPLLVKIYQLSATVGRGFAANGLVFSASSAKKISSNQWRLVITETDGSSFLEIAEVAMLDDYFTQTNRCVGGSASASAGTASAAFDASLASSWLITATGLDVLAYQFTKLLGIKGYSITAPASSLTRCPKSWRLECKQSSWVTVHTVTGQTAWSVNEKRTFIF